MIDSQIFHDIVNEEQPTVDIITMAGDEFEQNCKANASDDLSARIIGCNLHDRSR